MSEPDAIVLFAHGARDPQWAQPLERVAEALRARLPGAAVRLAFLELMQPALAEALAALAAEGRSRVTVVPVFLGQGGHVKRDLPQLVAAARRAHPEMTIALEPAIGEQPEVIAAIAGAIAARAAQAESSGRSR